MIPRYSVPLEKFKVDLMERRGSQNSIYQGRRIQGLKLKIKDRHRCDEKRDVHVWPCARSRVVRSQPSTSVVRSKRSHLDQSDDVSLKVPGTGALEPMAVIMMITPVGQRKGLALSPSSALSHPWKFKAPTGYWQQS